MEKNAGSLHLFVASELVTIIVVLILAVSNILHMAQHYTNSVKFSFYGFG